MKISKNLILGISWRLGVLIIVILSLIGAVKVRHYLEKKYPPKANSTIIIDNGNSVKLKTRDELDIYLINRYIQHLKSENDTVELKVVNDVLNSRYNMP